MKVLQRLVLVLGLVVLAVSALFPPREDLPSLSFRWHKTILNAGLAFKEPVRRARNPVDIGAAAAEWVLIGSSTAMIIVLLDALSNSAVTRRRKRGLCVKCNYDLTGNESGVCPECGEAIRPRVRGQ